VRFAEVLSLHDHRYDHGQRDTLSSVVGNHGASELLAYEQAKGRLQRQVDRLAEIRTNTNFILATTALVGSFLGARALDASGVDALEVVALIALVLGVLCGIRPLWPIRDHQPHALTRTVASRIGGPRLEDWLGLNLMWRGNVRVEDVARLGREPGGEGVYARVAHELEKRAEDDSQLIDKRLRWTMGCALLLALQVLLWAVALIASG
jgi:hypothetical protein